MLNAIRTLIGFAVVFIPVAASAHILPDTPHDFGHGFAHPFNGVDHVLAMVGVGILAAHLGGRAIWMVPLAFVSVMAIAAVGGMAAIELPFAEYGIGLSIVVFGAAVALRLHLPTTVAAVLVGFFAIFHGYSHGVEMPGTASALTYGLGFVCATCLLHALGLGAGITMERSDQVLSKRVIQSAGAAMSLAGVAVLAGIL